MERDEDISSVHSVCVIQAGVRTVSCSHREPAVFTVVVSGSGVLTQVTTAGRAVSAALEPVHHVLQMSAVAAALTPDKQSLYHMVTHCAHTGTLVAPAGKTHGALLELPGNQHYKSSRAFCSFMFLCNKEVTMWK